MRSCALWTRGADDERATPAAHRLVREAIVVDSSLAVEALTGRAAARERLGSSVAFAPHLIDAEITQALRGLVHGGHLRSSQASLLLATWVRLGVVRFALHPLLERMWALRDNVSAYDAAYVALAEELGCPLLTADARLARAPGLHCDVQVLGRA